MRTRIVLSAFAAALLAFPATAAEKDKDKKDQLVGTFAKKDGDFEMSFEFKKDSTFKFKMSNGGDTIDADLKFTREKDGTVKAEIVDIKTTGNAPNKEKGYKFSFKAKLDGKKLTISDIDGEGIDDNGKALLGGDYEKK